MLLLSALFGAVVLPAFILAVILNRFHRDSCDSASAFEDRGKFKG